jgi:hypothetical protein
LTIRLGKRRGRINRRLAEEANSSKETAVDHHDKIRAQFKGNNGDDERCRQLLGEFLAAFEGGGPDDGSAALSRRIKELEVTFEQELKELQELL